MSTLSTVGLIKVESGNEFQWIDEAMGIVVTGVYVGGFCEITGRIDGKVRRTGCVYTRQEADLWSRGNQDAIEMVHCLREKINPPPPPIPPTQQEAVRRLADYLFDVARRRCEVRLGYCAWPRTEGGDAT